MERTPEEVKKGLECCYSPVEPMMRCEECPYHGSVVCKMRVHTDAIAYIQLLETRVPRWISVEDDEKPKHGKDFLCICSLPNDKKHEWDWMAVLRWHAHGDNGYVNGPHFQHEGMEGMKVTHWMPLPLHTSSPDGESTSLGDGG